MKKLNIIGNRKNYNLTGFNVPEVFQVKHFIPVNNCRDTYKYAIPTDTALHSHGAVLAAASIVTLSNGATCNLIMHDTGFLKLPVYVQKFLNFHEIGHIVHGDLSMTAEQSKKIILQRSFGILPKIETNADKYAASVLGTMVVKKSLLFLVKHTNLPLISKLEMLRRYWKLK